MTARRWSWRRALEGVAVGVLLAFVGVYLARHWREVRAYPWELDPLPLAGATVLAALSLVGFGSIWTGLLRAMGEPVGWRAGYPIWLVSALARYIPGKFWHISGMAYMARRRGIRAVHALGANFLLQMLVIAIGTLLFVATVPRQIAAIGGTAVEVALFLAAALLVALYLSPAFDALYAWGLRLLRQPVPPERLSVRQKLLFGLATAAVWTVYGASFWLFMLGTAGRAPPLPTAIGICAAGYVGGFLAIFTPSGLGVRESLYALLLEPYVPASVALAVALLARLWGASIEVALAAAATALAGKGELPGGEDAAEGKGAAGGGKVYGATCDLAGSPGAAPGDLAGSPGTASTPAAGRDV